MYTQSQIKDTVKSIEGMIERLKLEVESMQEKLNVINKNICDLKARKK